MPGEKHRYVMLLVPCPPSDLVTSKIAWYSGVSGAFWSRAHRPGPPIGRHCPLKSGYFESSQAEAPAIVTQSAPTSAIAAIELRQSILDPPLIVPHGFVVPPDAGVRSPVRN